MESINLDSVIRTYRLYAPIYDLAFGAVLNPGRKALATRVAQINPPSLLEIGVGTGLMLDRYPIDTAIVGIDVSQEMLRVARQRQAQNGSRRSIELLSMNAECLSFPDHVFDCVTLPYVLSVTPNPKELITQARRVCRPGGTILILNHFSGSRFWWALERLFSPLAEKVGFRSNFQFDELTFGPLPAIQSVTTVNLFGLSKLVELRND